MWIINLPRSTTDFVVLNSLLYSIHLSKSKRTWRQGGVNDVTTILAIVIVSILIDSERPGNEAAV
ncbi:hypothetical protein BU24DRAFT_419012 [Aaosphaeria arxii CBS 175.79]|uniref:Uncharacterized protein n=1 Tax=Aaosphaeria arxii CBS 175.79 TaxID=1450172 RepID=A0A6A5Y1G0_9PLEO|nr:uncharacterized protein BU24DRAFT_419012 [Aaosphaeria arxii CBS 175.79]KAF2019395.1 hypothetical protein BU24DRAFT_419012 [Aaosphaeria arxii CBS 175.79]